MTGTWLPWVPWSDVYLWGLWACAAAQAGFVALLVTTKWRKWAAGRALFVKSTVLAVMFALSLAAWYALVPHLLEVAAVLMWVMAGAIGYMFWTLVQQKARDRKSR